MADVSRLLVVHDDALGMRFGGDHPTDGRRHRLAVALCREAGFLAAPGVTLEPAPGPLPDEALERVFAPAFVRAVRRYSASPVLAASHAAHARAESWCIPSYALLSPPMPHWAASGAAASTGLAL